MAADAPAPCVARTSAAIVSTKPGRQISVVHDKPIVITRATLVSRNGGICEHIISRLLKNIGH